MTINVIIPTKRILIDIVKIYPKIENKIGKDERKRGWGLQLIQELMDSVEFEHLQEY